MKQKIMRRTTSSISNYNINLENVCKIIIINKTVFAVHVIYRKLQTFI